MQRVTITKEYKVPEAGDKVHYYLEYDDVECLGTVADILYDAQGLPLEVKLTSNIQLDYSAMAWNNGTWTYLKVAF